MSHTQGQETLSVLREIAGHLNRIQTQQQQIIDLLMLSNGLRALTEDERKWLADCRREARGQRAA